MNVSKLLALAAALLLAGCATSDRDARPDWLDGSSARYPASAYLTGLGSADDLDSARDRARADLAKTFRVTVDETASDLQRYTAAGSGSEFVAEIRRDLSVRTQQVLEGVTVPESWQDPASRRFHALAVLDRAQGAARLRSEIGGLDAAAEATMSRARGAEDPFTRARLALEVVENQRRREALNDMLQAVAPTGQGVAPRWPLARLEADLGTALSRVTLRVAGHEPWASVLAGQLADAGFRVSPRGEYLTSLGVEEVQFRRDGWYWRRATMVLDIQGPDGAALGQQRWELKESATDAATAEMRLREKVAELLAREGRDAVLKIVRN